MEQRNIRCIQWNDANKYCIVLIVCYQYYYKFYQIRWPGSLRIILRYSFDQKLSKWQSHSFNRNFNYWVLNRNLRSLEIEISNYKLVSKSSFRFSHRMFCPNCLFEIPFLLNVREHSNMMDSFHNADRFALTWQNRDESFSVEGCKASSPGDCLESELSLGLPSPDGAVMHFSLCPFWDNECLCYSFGGYLRGHFRSIYGRASENVQALQSWNGPQRNRSQFTSTSF